MNLPYLENELASQLPLDGEWQFALGEAPSQSLPVPSAWEAHTVDKITDGPALYRRTVELPVSWLSDQHIYFEAGAVSFDATLRVNGQVAGVHRGMWSPFQWDITSFLRSGENALEIEVWKPGRRFPVRDSLAGFLPDVATTFGGIWQGVRLTAFPGMALSDLRVLVGRDGWVDVQGGIVHARRQGLEAVIELLDAGAHCLRSVRVPVEPDHLSFATRLELGDGPEISRWTPGAGTARYSLAVSLDSCSDGTRLARAVRRIGLRDMGADGSNVLLNGQPLSLRGVLDWGWDPERICPAPPPEVVRSNFAGARTLGFNLVKLCLFVPDETTFDVADEEGMLLWLEMPLWLPHVTRAFRELALREYEAIFRRVHHHPSIVMISLGCELNAEADGDFLAALDRLARAWFPNCLICDNSGSAEAYGGVLTSLSDFYDYHFYTDPHFFQSLGEQFDRAYRPRKPWIYGEFCDADTLRDFSLLTPEPWWLTDEVTLKREDFLAVRAYKRRLAEANVTDAGAALTRIARRQATAIRKYIVERVRSSHASGGYVITGWADTPIATSGVVDDQLNLKFAPEEWRQFNADRVLTIERQRRRAWVHGGDRPAYRDPFTFWQDAMAGIHVLLSNGGGAVGRGRLKWRLSDADGSPFASGTQDAGGVAGGAVEEIAVLQLPMERALETRPTEFVLSAALTVGDTRLAENSWRIFAVPRPRLPSRVAVAGSLRYGHNFARLDQQVEFVDHSNADAGHAPLIADQLSHRVVEWARVGGSALLWLRQPDRRFTQHMPFWREAIHVFEPHPLWERVPHAGWADMRFFGVATDFAIDIPKLAALLGPDARCTPVWRRFDARAMTWADYVVDVRYGAGRLFVSTLRFEGGLGHQPNSFDTNPLGSWMLAALLGLHEFV